VLSYRHGYHAGNFADLLKHLVLLEVLDYLQRKPGPIDVIDTHAGAGVYSLTSSEASTVGEFRDGIGRWLPRTSDVTVPASLERLLDGVWSFNAPGELTVYPGSPALAAARLREGDAAHLFELHPTDFAALKRHFRAHQRVHVHHRDGFEGLVAMMPRRGRRAIALIDPTYEVKADYDTAVETVLRAHRRMATAVTLLWYPVVDRGRVKAMERRLSAAPFASLFRCELGPKRDSAGRGMTSAGLFVVNPPWTLASTLNEALPIMARALGERGVWRCEMLVKKA